MNRIRLHTGCFPFIRDMGKTLTNEGWIHPDRNANFNVFIFVIKGQMQVVEEGKEYLLTEGTGFFLKSGLHHWGGPGTLADTSTIWAHFYDRVGESLPTKVVEERSLPSFRATQAYQLFTPSDYQYELVLPKLFHLGQPSALISKLKELYELYSSAPLFSHLTLSMKTMDIFLDIYRLSLKRPKLSSKSDAVVQKLADYLEEHWENKLDPEQIASEFQLNYRHMSTLFTSKMGISLFNYHERLRIHKSAELLRTTTFNVSEVSDRLHFTNP
ncbi:helix-turn-helix domain-containing protein [Paenibacillus sp. WC2504]|uniref:helix-turn-helix domain-containing protein n=1 Tax=Paenibacillus sp. WC2504 TaxID=3461403 RepID=UPI004045B087